MFFTGFLAYYQWLVSYSVEKIVLDEAISK